MAEGNRDRRPSQGRGEMAILVAVVLGILLGTLIKRVRIGLLLGLGLGLVIVFLGAIRSSRKNNERTR